MKNTFSKSSVLILLLISGVTLHAQEAVVASGGEAAGSGGNTSYSVGQVSFITNFGSNGTVGEGVQQPYEVLTLNVKENFKHLELLLFPNPTRENLNLHLRELDLNKVSYKVYDSKGKLILENAVEESEVNISLGDNPPGNYFLNLFKGNQSIKSFKVVKN